MTAKSWRYNSLLSQLRQRAFLVAQIRDFFAQRDVLEVQTPILSRYGNTDLQIEVFTTQGIDSSHQQSYLRTSPEFFHKRLLASGSGDIYELAPVFRGAEKSKLHNPEFTLLEWYRLDFTLDNLMDEVADLFHHLCDRLNRDKPVAKKISYEEVFIRHTEENPFDLNDAELNQFCVTNGYVGETLNRAAALDYVFAILIQPKLEKDVLWLIYDFPLEQAALAQAHPQKTDRCLRFEMLYQGIELANGYQELEDGQEQRRRFQQDLQQRKQEGKDDIAIDEHLLSALASGLPPCSGVAIGVERLQMCLTESDCLQDVMGFTAENS